MPFPCSGSSSAFPALPSPGSFKSPSTSPMGTAGPHRAKAQWLAYDLQLPGPIGDAALGHLPVAKRPHQSSVGAI